MRKTTVLLFASAAITLALACSPENRNYGGEGGAGGTAGSGSTGGQGGVGGQSTIPMTCATYAQAVCDQYAVCSPGSISLAFGDAATCVARYSIYCTSLLTANGTGWTEPAIAACAGSYAATDCNLFLAQPFRNLDEYTPPGCTPAQGTLVDDAPCLDNTQCMSGNCHHAAGAFCGSCKPKGALGDPCTVTSDCQAHQICWGGACATAGEVGEACDLGAKTPCAAPWPCFGGVCSKPGQLGDTCGGNGPDCAILQGLYCGAQSYKCEQVAYAAPDSPCGDIQGVITQCAAGGACVNGACILRAEDGAACDPNAGPYCMLPALCINGSCALPDPSVCQ